MKKALALLLVFIFLLSACIPIKEKRGSNPPIENNQTQATLVSDTSADNLDEDALVVDPEPADSKSAPRSVNYTGLNDPALLNDYERAIYSDVSRQLGTGYIVQNVSAVYVSKEYIDELTYNSQANIFFGYTLADLDAQFQGTRYIFTLGENNETIVVPFEKYDDTYEKVLKNVAIGTGVILVCVVVSVATAGMGTAPAISMIFAASAKTGAIFAASSGAFSAVVAGTVTGMQTGDWNEALKAGALAGSESFKWGAITGAITGGASELVMLKTAAKGGLTLNEAATIIQDAKLPANFVKQISSVSEYNELVAIAEANGMTIQDMSSLCMTTGYPLQVVKMMKSTKEGLVYFEQAGLYAETINGQTALIRSIDLTYESELAGKTVTNLERMRLGYAAIDPVTGKAFQLHHIGQSVDSPLAILSQFEHTGGGNNGILHNLNIEGGNGVHSILPDAVWSAQKSEFWKALAAFFEG